MKIPPNEEKVITDPVPDVDKPEKLVNKIMGKVFIGKRHYRESVSGEKYANSIFIRDFHGISSILFI